MKLNRREFLTVSAATGIVGAVAPAACAFTLPDPPQKARLRLSCQEGVAPGKSLAEKLDFLEANGMVKCYYKSLSAGIACIIVGFKPEV